MSEQPIAFEEAPDSHTSQQAIDQPQRERMAYEELQPGDVIQEGDEWQHESGRWKPFAALDGFCERVRHAQRARRSYSITALEKYQGQLLDDIQQVIGERDEARAKGQQLLKTIAENADRFAEHTRLLVGERDEAKAELNRLQEVVSNLYSEPTARQVQDMLRTWITAVDWSAGCFDSAGREQIDTIQKTLIAVMERIDTLNPEGKTDGN